MRGLATVPLLATACNQVLGIPEVHRGCRDDAELTEVVPVGGLTSPLGVQGAQLSRDELTIVFSRLTVSGPAAAPIARLGDLYVAHRDARDSDFREPTPLDELNTESDQLGASLSDDQRTIYVARRTSAQRYEIVVATRSASDGRFGVPAPVDLGDRDGSDIDPYITSTALYFARKRSDGSARLFTAAGGRPTFADPRPLTSIETPLEPAAREDPIVSPDGLTLYFSAPPDNASPRDIWIASRQVVDQEFSTPARVAALDTNSDERPAWISNDRCRLYFITNRTGRGSELWMASRTP
jgi:hypothetical protein